MTSPPVTGVSVDCGTGEVTEITLEGEALAAYEDMLANPHITYVETRSVQATATTTDDVPKEVFRFPCDQMRRYRASLLVSGIDQGNFVSRDLEGRFVWKRTTGNAIMVGIEVVSSLGEPASASWAPNALPSGADIVFTVKGASGRTIDWELGGSVNVFAPGGLET